MLSENVFPKDVLVELANHMKNPAASSTRDQSLMKALKLYDYGREIGQVLLEEVDIGQSFLFQKRKFQKMEKRRTRALCLDLNTKKKYTVPLTAEVKLI
ncbi:MAG: SprT protein [Algoriphagus sp.]|jgi:SprT protein